MLNSDLDSAPPGFERSLAVVIDINAYSHGIPPLLTAVRDANAFADSLERQSPSCAVLPRLEDVAVLAFTRKRGNLDWEAGGVPGARHPGPR